MNNLVKLMCLSLVASCGHVAPAQADPWDRKVTFQHVAGSVQQVVDDLAEKTRLPLKCSPSLNGEIILVSVTDVPVEELLDKIAVVTAGSWSEKDGVRTLVRSAKALEQDQQHEFAARLALIKQFQSESRTITSRPFDAKAMVAEAESMGYSTPQYVIRNTSSKTPAHRFLSQVFASVDAGKIARLALGERLVFSTTQTRMQQAMPSNFASVLAKFLKDEQDYASAWILDAAKRKAADGEAGHNFVRDLNFTPQRIRGSVKTAMLVVSQTGAGSWPHWNLELNLYGDSGQRIGKCTDEIFRWKTGLERTLADRYDPKEKDVAAELSPTDIEICLHSHDWSIGGAHPPSAGLEPATLDLFAHPDKYDPLSFSASKLFFAAATSLDKDLVAQPTEEAFDLANDLYSISPKFMTAGRFIAVLGLYGMEIVTHKGGWVTIGPDAPASNRIDRASRPGLATAITELRSGKVSDLDVAEAYLAKQPSLTDTRSSGSWVDLAVGRHVIEFGWSGGDLLPFRFYGILARAKMIPSAGKIGTVPPTGQVLLNRMVFASADSFEALDLEPLKLEAPLPTIAREPTFTLDTGLPIDANVIVTTTLSPAVFGSAPGRPEFSVRSMAEALYGLETGASADIAPTFNPKDLFSSAQEQSIKVKLEMTANIGASFEIHRVPPANAEPVPYDQLPEDFRKAVQLELQKIRKRQANRQETIPPLNGKQPS